MLAVFSDFKKAFETINSSKNLNRKSNFIRRLRKGTDFITMVIPHIDYCNTILFNVQKGDMAQLQGNQNNSFSALNICQIGFSRKTKTMLQFLRKHILSLQ